MKVIFIFLVALTFFFFACKHEIPVQPIDPGPVNPPQVTCNADTVYFQQQIIPIFVSNCTFSGCHDEISQQDGIVLTNYNGIMGETVPFNLGGSKIWEKINDNDPSDQMPPPPRNPLTLEQKNLIRTWILQGAINNTCQASVCDTTNVTYSVNIRSIVSTKCQGCHSSSNPANGYDLSTYAGVKARVTDGKLWGTINHQVGFSPMPKNGNKLSDCEIVQFRKWIDAGAPEN